MRDLNVKNMKNSNFWKKISKKNIKKTVWYSKNAPKGAIFERKQIFKF